MLMLKPKRTLLIIILICLGLLYVGFKILTPNKSLPTIEVPKVTVETLSYKAFPLTVTSYAQVVSRSSVILRAQADGVIAAIHFKPGEFIKKGQLLFTLQSNTLDKQVKSLEAQLSLSKQRRERITRLAELAKGAVAKFDLLQTQAEYEQSLAQYEGAKAIHTITAPVNGIISDTKLAVGDFVKSGTALAYLIDTQKIELKYQLPSQYADKISLGQTVIFSPAGSQQAYSTSVSYIAPLLNSEGNGITLGAILPGKAWINSQGIVIHQLEPNHTALAVNDSYVQTDAQGFYLYELTGDKIAKHYFIPGEINKSGLIEIKTGISAGSQIVTSDPDGLSEGQRVEVIKS
jgi:membrane fusion protein (multidrug efflux system)